MTTKKKKLKHLIKLREVSKKYKRIMSFKRPKWVYLQRFYKKKFYRRSFFRRRRLPFFYSQSLLQTSLRWTRLRFSYKRFLLAKNRFYSFYRLNSSVASLKKVFKKSKSIFEFLVKFEKRLDVLLWRLGFFQNPIEAKFFISHKKVLVNGSNINIPNRILKEGDLVQFCPSISKALKENLSKKKEFLLPYYAECNYDSLEFFLIGDLGEYSLKRMSYLYSNYLDLSGLKNYFRRI